MENEEQFLVQCLLQQQDLLVATKQQIDFSRREIRYKLEPAASRSLISRQPADMRSSPRVHSLITATHMQFDRFETDVLPLVEAHLSELTSLIELHEQQLRQPHVNKDPVHESETRLQPEQGSYLQTLPNEYEPQTQVETSYLVECRDILKKDLSEYYPVGSESGDEDVGSLSFNFPVCRVSKCCLSILDLVTQVLSDAEFSDDQQLQVKLQNTAKRLMELFVIGLPVKHLQQAKLDLKYAAYFHNTCLFAAHFLLTSPQITECPIDFNHLITRFQTMGESVVRDIIDQKKESIRTLFQDPHVVQCLIDGGTSELVPLEEAVSRSLLILKIVKESWIEILPRNVYNNMTASLMTVLLNEIIRLVLLMQDIASTTAEKMVQLMSNLKKDLPDFLCEPHEGITALLPNSFQFMELERVLKSGLAETVSRWGSGFGPLSVAFRADQVRKLIRALFQNNDLRTTALNKIREF